LLVASALYFAFSRNLDRTVERSAVAQSDAELGSVHALDVAPLTGGLLDGTSP
jgi:hypothetical protein